MMEKYKFRKYDKKFQELFKREKSKLKKIISSSQIEHIGSTAILDLGGKGIIDVIISVPKGDIKKARDKLNEAGYYFIKKAGDKNRLFFEKDYKSKGKIRRVHIHLTSKNSKVWKNAIAVRDYLRKNKKEAEKYVKLKKEAVKICKGEGKVYKKSKDDFLRELTEKALGDIK